MKEENKVSEAVKVIYKRVRFWEHPKFHEAMSNEEIIKMSEEDGADWRKQGPMRWNVRNNENETL